jgi:hypothetical protein
VPATPQRFQLSVLQRRLLLPAMPVDHRQFSIAAAAAGVDDLRRSARARAALRVAAAARCVRNSRHGSSHFLNIRRRRIHVAFRLGSHRGRPKREV